METPLSMLILLVALSAALGIPSQATAGSEPRCETLFSSPSPSQPAAFDIDPLIIEDLANLHLDAEEASHSVLANKYRRLLEEARRKIEPQLSPHLQQALASRIQMLRNQRNYTNSQEDSRKQVERQSLTTPGKWENPRRLPIHGQLLWALSEEVLFISRRLDPSGNQSEIIRYNVKTQQIEKVWQDPQRNKTAFQSDPWYSHVISRNGERIYYVRHHHIGFIETKTNLHREVLLPFQKNAQIIHFRLSPDEQSLIAYQSDDDLIVARSDLNLNRYVYRGWHNFHPDHAIDYSPDGRYLLIGDTFNFQIRDLKTPADLFLGRYFDPHQFASGRFSADSQRLLYIQNTGEFSSFDFHTHEVHKTRTPIFLNPDGVLLPLTAHPWVVGQSAKTSALANLPVLIDYQKGLALAIDYSPFEFFKPSPPVLAEGAGAIFFTDQGVDRRGHPTSYLYRIDLETREVQQFRRELDDLEEVLTVTQQGDRLLVGSRKKDNALGYLE